MFIVWGKKLVYRQLGYVGHFCPICRVPRPFRVQRVGLAGHVYYITSGDGDLVCHERVCQECGTAIETDSGIFTGYSKTLLPLNQLFARTYPNFAADFKARLELEDKVRTTLSFITRDERHALLQQPFVLLSPKVQVKLASMQLDVPLVLWFFGAILLGPPLASLLQHLLPDSAEGYVTIGMLLLGAGLVIWQAIGTGRRYINRNILPVLAKCLRPLKPTEAEMRGVLAELKKYKHKLGSKLRLADLMEALQKPA